MSFEYKEVKEVIRKSLNEKRNIFDVNFYGNKDKDDNNKKKDKYNAQFCMRFRDDVIVKNTLYNIIIELCNNSGIRIGNDDFNLDFICIKSLYKEGEFFDFKIEDETIEYYIVKNNSKYEVYKWGMCNEGYKTKIKIEEFNDFNKDTLNFVLQDIAENYIKLNFIKL